MSSISVSSISSWLRLILALLVACAATAAEAPPPGNAHVDAATVAAQAEQAYNAKDYQKSAALYRTAIGAQDHADYRYNLACCLALSGDAERALEELGKSIDMGFSYADHMVEDPDLASLRADARFSSLVARAQVLQKAEQGRQAKFAALPPAKEVFALPVPATEAGDRKFRLIVALHGVGDNPAHFFGALKDWARQSGFALLAISGSRALTDAGNAYRWTMPGDADRVHNIVAKVVDTQPIDRARVYMLGFSQGGVMVYFVAFNHPDTYAGIISMSGALQSEHFAPGVVAAAAAKLPVAIIHGEQDTAMPFALGRAAETLVRDAHGEVILYPFTGGHQFPPNYPALLSRAVDWLDAHKHR